MKTADNTFSISEELCDIIDLNDADLQQVSGGWGGWDGSFGGHGRIHISISVRISRSCDDFFGSCGFGGFGGFGSCGSCDFF